MGATVLVLLWPCGLIPTRTMCGHQSGHHAVALRAPAFAHSTHLLSFAEPIYQHVPETRRRGGQSKKCPKMGGQRGTGVTGTDHNSGGA